MDLLNLPAVAEILADVYSIHDLTPPIIAKLKKTNVGRISLDGFDVGPTEFLSWHQNIRNAGLEYDAQSRRVILRATHCGIYREMYNDLYGWLEKVAADLQIDNKTFNLVTRRDCSRILRNDPYKDCVKEADLAIFKEGNYFPVLAVEFGVTDDEQRLYDEAEKWLRGSHGVTKMVMLVHIGETWESDDGGPPQVNESEGGLTWGLTDNQILEFRGPEEPHNLCDHIIQWYQANRANLVGTLSANITLLSNAGTQRFLLGKTARQLRDIYLAGPALPEGPIVGFPIAKLDLLLGEYPNEYFRSVPAIRQQLRQFAMEGERRVQTEGYYYLPLEPLRRGLYYGILKYMWERAEYKAERKLRQLREERH